MRKMFLAGAMVMASTSAMVEQARATTIVVTPNGNAGSPGTNNVNSPFGAAGTPQDTYVMQVQYAASMFGGVAIGSQLSSIGFRLATGATTISKALNYTNFEIQVGSGANALGSLSRTFSANEGADTIVARTGALTIAKNSFVADACTNRRRCPTIVPTNSFYTIDFTTPYTYIGGDITLTFTSQLAAATVGQIVTLDAVDPQRLSTIVSTVATSSNGTVPTRGLPANFFFAPILQFAFAPPPPPPAAVPEPASWAMMVGGFGMLGAVMRTGKRRTPSFG